MNAIVLAAGKGSRISDEIGPIPKSTLEIDGKPIIRRTVEMLLGHGMNVVICTGYRHALIEEALKGLSVKYVNNPFYDVTNNIASLWFAQKYLNDECIIISADVIFNEDLLNKIINKKDDLVMVTDSSRISDGDYFFHMSDNGTIEKYGPEIPLDERDYEYVGIDKVSLNVINDFRDKLNEMIDGGEINSYFENVFFTYINHSQYRLTVVDVAGCVWREIDKINDYQKAKDEFRTEESVRNV